MKKTIFLVAVSLLFITISSCEDETFMKDVNNDSAQKPSNLIYSEILGARENSKLISGSPSVETDNLIPMYEIISGKKSDGTLLDDTYLKDVSVSNIDAAITPVNFSKAGIITIEEGNNFVTGDYYFTIKVSTEKNGIIASTIFEDIFHLNVGPLLVKDLLFSPIAQNLVLGTGNSTTKPYLLTGNPNVTFSLGSDDTKLKINSTTGVISLKEGYTTVENDTIYPKVIVTSTISGEVTEFQGDGFLMLVASTVPVELPKKTIYFFYPTLQAENALYGYRKNILLSGDLEDSKAWIQDTRSNLADKERPSDITFSKSLMNNVVIGGVSVPHDSEIIINSQDLTKYNQGYSVSSVFYIKNQYVEYLADGRTPIDLEVYYSTNFEGDSSAATWTKINDKVKSWINTTAGDPIIGTPYPGDQLGVDPDGKKDALKNADAKWVKCEFDLNSFKTEKNFTLKFKFASYFTGTISGATGRSGRFYISDVHFKATEE